MAIHQEKQFKNPSELDDHPVDSLYARNALLISLGCFLILAFLLGTIVWFRYNQHKQNEKTVAIAAVNNTKARLQESLANSLAAAKTLSFVINDDGTVKGFDSVANHLIEVNDCISTLYLSNLGVIKYVYPLSGYREFIGLDILKDSIRQREALKTIEKKKMFFAGPLDIPKFGLSFVGRLPLYKNEQFTGFSAVIIRMKTLFELAGINSTVQNGYRYQISKINPNSKKEEFYLAPYKPINSKYSVSVEVPNGSWKLAMEPVNLFEHYGDLILLSIMGLLLAASGGFFLYRLLKAPIRLQKLVDLRTRQLRVSENRYRLLFDKSPLPLLIYENDTLKILQVNESAVNLYGYPEEEITSLQLKDLFAPQELQPFLKRNNEEIEPLHDIGKYTHIRKNKSEMRLLSYSRPINYQGIFSRLLLLVDVTAKDIIERELVINEEKYRLLIEQASDGVVVSDLIGDIREVNKSICEMSGYTADEMLGKNVSLFIPQEDLEKDPLHFKELIEGKSFLYQRRMRKKDGTLLPVEISTKMVDENTFIGLIRDITIRKRAEDEIAAHSELLRELYRSSQQIREDERTHIAREIHDELGQQLTGLKMDLSWLTRKLKNAETEITGKLTETISLIDKTIHTVRKIATELRPSILDDLGLIAALEWQTEEFGKRYGIDVHFNPGITDLDVQQQVKSSVFRIYQELLTNVARHAEATHVDTSIKLEDNQLVLIVKDDGTGFETNTIINKKTLGLRGIKERTGLIGGELDIFSKPGEGTIIKISVPLQKLTPDE